MKIANTIVPPVIAILMIAGCTHYRSTGRVTLDTPDIWVYSEEIIYSEVQALNDIASQTVTSDGKYEIQHSPDTTLFRVSVTTSDPENSAELCNTILTTYASTTNAPFKRVIVDPAEPNYGRVW